MERILTQFASAEAHAAEKADLFSSLGIDWKLLILQTVAFLILLVILRKVGVSATGSDARQARKRHAHSRKGGAVGA